VIQDLLDRAERRGDQARVAEMEAELALPAFPKGLEYVWRIFWRLRRRKGSNGFSVSPIEWPDIDAFVRNAHMTLLPWEIEILEDLDDTYLAEQAKRLAKRKPDAGPNKN
jgi:hypothetical protein